MMYALIITKAEGVVDFKVPGFCFDDKISEKYPLISPDKEEVRRLKRKLKASFPDSKYKIVKFTVKDLLNSKKDSDSITVTKLLPK